MRVGAIYRAGSDTCLVPLAWKTANAWERLRGLLARPPLTAGQALLIDPCPSVHTLGMRYALDLVFLGPDFHVLKQVSRLRPLRWAGCPGARATLELAPGTLATLGLNTGDPLQWRKS